MERQIEECSRRIIELNNIRFDKEADWTAEQQREHDLLVKKRRHLLERKVRGGVTA